jgi:uncharacterized SAM-binding protein YcdF (DUF218 family)
VQIFVSLLKCNISIFPAIRLVALDYGLQNFNQCQHLVDLSGCIPRTPTPDCAFLLAGSAILQTCRALFNHLLQVEVPVTLVIAGGIGHSTHLLYDAIERHAEYGVLYDEIKGLPEARVIERILEQFWQALARRAIDGQITLLVEDQSTNCSENGIFAQQLLQSQGITPGILVLVQDPTMSVRTAAGLRKIYLDMKIVTWPTFVPTITPSRVGFGWSQSTLEQIETTAGLWAPQRSIDLIVGEIPRLRLYGPDGKGPIAEMQVPADVLAADGELRRMLEGNRYDHCWIFPSIMHPPLHVGWHLDCARDPWRAFCRCLPSTRFT